MTGLKESGLRPMAKLQTNGEVWPPSGKEFGQRLLAAAWRSHAGPDHEAENGQDLTISVVSFRGARRGYMTGGAG